MEIENERVGGRVKEGDRERESGRKSERLEIENERVGGRVKD